jgi:solute carrier family 8 (sodium/calcium exchanger)
MFFYFSVDEGTSPYNEPMFLVHYSPLVELFGRFCFNCKAENPKVQVKHIGSMATVVQACSKCLMENFTWRSQPMVMGRYAAGNIMTSFGILMSGINISQAMLMFRHMNLATISVRTYHIHQSTHLFPAVLKHWEVYQSGLIEEVKDSGEESQTWSGDGRFDSMGHSAKYGVYTMWSNTTSKLVHFELVQV